MTKGKTQVLQKKTIDALTREAGKVKKELESYLDDLDFRKRSSRKVQEH